MTAVTVNDTQAKTMLQSGELVEVRDETGTVIGFFAPVKLEYVKEYAETAARAYSVWGSNGPPNRSMTTAEVITHLESLGAAQ